MKIQITCPKCYEALITIGYSPPTPGVHTMPNGDPGYPGDPAEVTVEEATCDCWPDEAFDEESTCDLFDHLVGSFLAFGDYYTGEEMRAMVDDAGT